MDRNPVLFNKTRVIGVILLFVGIAFAPSINANVKKEYVNITIEFCGLGGKHKVQLSSEEVEDLDILFDTLRLKLDDAESKDETVKIFNEGIKKLEENGLLGDMTIVQVQRLITERYQKSIMLSLSLDENENKNCLIIGRTTETWFESLGTVFCNMMMYHDPFNYNILLDRIFFVGYIFLSLFSYFNPFGLFYRINFGRCRYEHEVEPIVYYSSGWIYTISINGLKNWQGDMLGDLPVEGTFSGGFGTTSYDVNYPGAVGFTGLKISSGNEEFYLGYARHVKIEEI